MPCHPVHLRLARQRHRAGMKAYARDGHHPARIRQVKSGAGFLKQSDITVVLSSPPLSGTILSLFSRKGLPSHQSTWTRTSTSHRCRCIHIQRENAIKPIVSSSGRNNGTRSCYMRKAEPSVRQSSLVRPFYITSRDHLKCRSRKQLRGTEK